MKTFLAALSIVLALTACANGAEEPATPVTPAAGEAAAEPKAGAADNLAEQIEHWRDALNGAVARHDLDGVLRALDEIIKLIPQDYENYRAKISVLRIRADRAGIIKTRRDAAAALAGSSDGLNELAWELVLEPELELRDPELALKCAEEAVSLSKRKDAALLDTLARAWYELGMVEKAIELQKESLAASSSADERAQVKGALDYYETVLKVRAQTTDGRGAPK